MKIKKIQGSIVVRQTSSKTKNERLYIIFKGRRQGTGLPNTKVGWAKARAILEKLNERSIENRFGIQKKEKALTLFKAFEIFREERSNTRAAKTLETDLNAFKAFFSYDFSLKEMIIREGQEISIMEHCIRDAIVRNKKSSATLAIYLRSCAVFANWLYDEGYIKYPIGIKKLAKLIKSYPKKPIRVYSDLEIQAITEYLQKTHYKLLSSAILLMVHTGMRIHEVLELRWSHIYKDTIRIESKDRKTTQIVTITEKVQTILAEIPKIEDKVFPWSAESDGRLRTALYAAMKELNIRRDRRSFHEMRKTFITRLIVENKNMNLFDIANAARCKISVIEAHYLKYPVEQLKRLLE